MLTRRNILIAGALATAPFRVMAQDTTRAPVTLTYLGNAGWRIEGDRAVIIVDPYLTQFERRRASYTSTVDESEADKVLVPNEALINAHIPQADFVLVTHSHDDHMLDVPTVAKHTGAVIIGSEGSARLARIENIPEKQIIIVKGGEDLQFDRFSLRVIPSLHSELFDKHYNNSEFSGPVADKLKAPLYESAYHEGGTFAYLLRLAGHSILIMGAMNYIEREMEGLRPDIALIGSGASRKEIYEYSARLMRALGNPPIVLPTHWDSYGTKTDEQARKEVNQFAAEIKTASSQTRTIIPDYFVPMVFN